MKKRQLCSFGLAVGLASLALGCVIPPDQPPPVSPGSPASIGGAAPTATSAPPLSAPLAIKDCGDGALIDDGEDGNNQSLPNGGRGGYWYTFKDPGATTVDPQAGAYGGGAFTMSEGGHGSSWAARFHGKIGTGAIVFAGLGVNFVDPKGQYDATKYTGVTFWARRGESSTGKVRLKVPDVNTDKEAGVCSECFNDFGADFNFTTDWKQYVVPFKAMKQLAGWGAPRKPHITADKVYGLQWQVQVPSAHYDIYIDDVRFTCD
jgi:endoglucanase